MVWKERGRGAMRVRAARVVAVAVVALAASTALLCGSAAAFAVGSVNSNSAEPSVAIDQNGNAWVTWPAQPGANTLAVDVCEIPAGRGACATAPQQVATFPFDTFALRSSVFYDQARGALWLAIGADVGNREQLLVSASHWNGAGYPAFSAPVQVGTVDPGRGAAALDSADGLLLATADLTEQLFTQGAPITAPPPGETSSATLVYPSAGANSIFGSAISFDDRHLVAVWGSGLFPPGGPLSGGPLSYAFINASSLATASVNSSSSWSEGTLDDGGVHPQLTGGPAGTFLAETIPGSQTGFLDLRSFTGAGFTPPRPVYCSDNVTYGAGVQSNPALAEDPAGRLHLAYIAGRGSANGEDVRYVTINGGNQSAPQTIATNTQTSDLWVNPAVAGNATSAIAVWIGDTSDTLQAAWLPKGMPPASGCASPARASSVTISSQAPVRGGIASLTLACASTSTCAGSVKFTVKRRHKIHRHHRNETVSETLTLGSGRFTIDPDTRVTIHIRLSGEALSLLAQHRLQVSVVMTIGRTRRTTDGVLVRRSSRRRNS